MPYRFQLTWIPSRRKWRKRYQGRYYYLKSPCEGRSDRQGYLAALSEWSRLKAHLDNPRCPSPYSTFTGALLDDGLELVPADESSSVATLPESARTPDMPEWILSTGIGHFLNERQSLGNIDGNPHTGERRIEKLAKWFLDQQKKAAQRGELSLQQWDSMKFHLQAFRDFMKANYPTLIFINQIDASVLSLFRDKQWDLSDPEKTTEPIARSSLKKRLEIVGAFLQYLIDENVLSSMPKNMKNYAKVSLVDPVKVFLAVDDLKKLLEKSSERTQLYIMLGLNLGYTQIDIATLENPMIDWETGIVSRDRHKTGVVSQGKLWPSTLALLKKHRNPDRSGPVLVGEKGNPLLVIKINQKKDTLQKTDSIKMAFVRALEKSGLNGKGISFKTLRKTGSREVEKIRPDLTEYYLAHSEKKTKRFYTDRYFTELFTETDKLEKFFGFCT